MSTKSITAQGAVNIRPTQADDVTAFRDLRLEALRNHPEAFGADYAEQSTRPITAWEERVRRGAGSDLGITYVAEVDGALVAMVGIFREASAKVRHNGTIWGVYVRPAWRGAGLADRLIDACIDWAHQQRLRVARLAVATTNAPAIKCYLRCGFAVYGVDPEVIYHNGEYYDELLMMRRLPAAPDHTADVTDRKEHNHV
jgi:RimJ/RimL family protein N-acetyltransferase